jgi:uncharacterized Fe-S cluster-containing radical SAM superfamily protein
VAPPGRQQRAHVALNITKRCNQRCAFCFEGDRSTWQEPSLDEIRRLLEEAAATHRYVIFMGAEALLRTDILEVIRITRALGLGASIFTNGQALAREGVVDELAESGLRELDISFHYADAESFARGTGTHSKFFARLLRGLENVRDHNHRFPDQQINAKVETDLLIYNQGALAQIRSLLESHLGSAFTGHRVGTIQPIGRTARAGPLLAPWAERREELVDFIATQPPDRPLSFAKMPLCLIPGAEHRSIDVTYKYEQTDVRSNFIDKANLGDMHDHLQMYRTNPYRWVCRDCNLLALCPTQRTSWLSPGSAPHRDQKPQPVTKTTVRQVLERVWSEPIPAGQLAAVERTWRAISIPEAEIVAALRAASGEDFELLDVYCEDAPILDFEVGLSGQRSRLRLAPVGARVAARRSFLIRYLQLVQVDPPVGNAAMLLDAARRIAALPFPPLSEWRNHEQVNARLAGAALTLWHLLGARLWPGQKLTAQWTTEAFVASAGVRRLDVRHAEGQRAALLFEDRALRRAVGGPALGEPALRTESVDVHVAPAEEDGTSPEASLRIADLVAGLAKLLHRAGEWADAPVSPEESKPARPASPLPATSAPVRPDEPQADPFAYWDAVGTLRVRFEDRQGQTPDLVFLLKEAGVNERFYVSVGRTGLSYVAGSGQNRRPRGPVFRACVRSLLRAMRACPEPPTCDNTERWESLIQRSADDSMVSRRYRCVIEQRR